MPHYDIDDLGLRDEALLERIFPIVERIFARYHRAEVRGIERIPEGPALYVGNHNGAIYSIDTFLAFSRVLDELGPEAVPYGLGHEVAISLPGLNHLLVPLGAVRASHENAARLFELGRKVLVYPGGDYDALRPYSERNRIVFGGRRGYIRTALRNGVPIIPLVAHGAHGTLRILSDNRWIARRLGLDERFRLKVFPVSLALPWGIALGPTIYIPLPSRITAEFLEPIAFDRSGEDAASDDEYVTACARKVEWRLQRALARLARERGDENVAGAPA